MYNLYLNVVYIMFHYYFFQLLTEISHTWASMELSYEDHYQTVPLLKCDKELVETLEDHQVNLQVTETDFV